MTHEPEYCRNHHLRTEANTIWEKSHNGKFRRRCKDCRRENRANRSGRPIGLEGVVPRGIAEVEKLPALEREYVERFRYASKRVRGKCYGNPGPYADYDEDNIPSLETARGLCADCPMLALCGANAQVMHEQWGIWGGDVFVLGNIYKNGTA